MAIGYKSTWLNEMPQIINMTNKASTTKCLKQIYEDAVYEDKDLKIDRKKNSCCLFNFHHNDEMLWKYSVKLYMLAT
jgi:hypothetical protein